MNVDKSAPGRTWTDLLGRSYPYRPYAAEPIAKLSISPSETATLAVAEASRALGTVPSLPLAGIAAVLFRSESSASSFIEGISAGPRRILEAEVAAPGEVRDPIAERVVGNLEGLRVAVATGFSAGAADYLRWHRILMADDPALRGDDIGAFRSVQNWIGGDAYGPRDAEFIPPPPEDLETLVDDLARYVARTDVAPVIHALIAHARFEVIHPFVDGNGRVGRMLLQHLLVSRRSLPAPVPVSVAWSRGTDRYIAGLRAFQDGDIDDWLEYGAASVVFAVDWMHEVIDQLSVLIAELRGTSGARQGSVAWRVVEDLPRHPLVDGQSVAERYGVTRQAAHAALTRLTARGVLTERAFSRRTKPTGRPRQMFSSPAMLRFLEDLT